MGEIFARVHGRVQKVMFRDFVKRGARAQGLVGYVRNLPDGTVEILAQGERPELLRLIERLERGSLLSRVERVEVVWREPSYVQNTFTIAYE